MGGLPKPTVPAGPVRTLFDELHQLHHRAGWPSLRDMAKNVGASHTTVSAAFSAPRTPRWGLLELIVETLGGDTEHFRRLWLSASAATNSPEPPPPEPPDAPDRAPEAPRELPADVVGFTGRTDQLARLDRLLAHAGESSTAVVISAVSGTAGVGKTALAVHWAHRVADRFPDGQLYVNLRGYDPDKPLQPAEALAAFLRELGVDGNAIPHGLAERAARFRTLLSGKRMLVLLDNARSVEQVRDLLPGTGTCSVLVTSRDALPALVARHGAVRVNLDLLPAADAVALLRTLIGDRVDAEPEQAAALAERCARLPLALRIAAELAAARPTASLAGLVSELRDERRRLDLLAAGDDEYTAVRAVFSWSYRNLDADAARAFQLLGLHPGREVDGYAMAALAGTDLPAARRLLGALARANLVEETGDGRFGMHDLLRAYAIERAAELPEPDRRESLDRLFDYHQQAATAAMALAFPHEQTGPIEAGPHAPSLTPATARAWLDTERPNLLAVAEIAVDGRPSHTTYLATSIAQYLDFGAHYQDALTMHGLALQAARSDGDRAGEAYALNHMGAVFRRLGRYREAADHHQLALGIHRETGDRIGECRARHGLGILFWRSGRHLEACEQLEAALAIYREIGDRVGEGRALSSIGSAYRRLGRYPEAVDHHEQALAIHRAIGDRVGEGRALSNLGVVCVRLGRYQEAIEHHRLSLQISQDAADRTGQGISHTNLGTAYGRLGRYPEAIEQHRAGLAFHREVGYRVGQADGLHGLGVVFRRMGRHDEAIDQLRQALTLAHEIGEADIETGALNDLATTQRAAGRLDEACKHYESALTLAGQTGDRFEQARAHDGIGHLHANAGRTAEARQHWQRAVAIYTELGVPMAAEVRDQLAQLDAQVEVEPFR